MLITGKKKTSVLNERIIGKKQLVFIIEDTDGEIFGYYENSQIVEIYRRCIETDEKSFEFNIKSNGIINKLMKFEIKDLELGGICLFNQSSIDLIKLGNSWLIKENNKNKSYCRQNEDNFYYHEIKNALCGKLFIEAECFTPKRILVIQMK